jgi:parallel beta helix pectate lyase-like protein/PKD domain-containing protein/Big-like domain-containing protein
MTYSDEEDPMFGNRWLITSLSVLIIFGGLLAGCSSGSTPNAQLLGITVSPQSAKIVVGETKQFTATGQFNDGSTRDISPEVVWHSTNESIATIDVNGLATGISEGGTTLITATAGNLTSDPPAVLEVVDESNRLTSISIEPPVAQIQLGASRSFVAMGTYLDNSTQEITNDVVWESSNPTLVSISNNPGSKGVAIGLASGEVQITAWVDDLISDPVTVTVTEVALLSIAVSPLDPTLPLGAVQEFKATGTYSDDSTADLTKVVTWMSSNKVVADFSAEAGEEGYCTALAEGSTSVTAISGSVISDPVSLTVTSATLQEISIEPAAPSVPVGTEVQFSAMGRYSDNQLLDITSMVTWNSSDLTKVAFDLQTEGLAEALEFGSAEIWASLGAIESNRVTMTVNSADLVSIDISPVNPTLPIGQQLAFTAYGHYSDLNVVDITSSVTWDSSDKSVAIISNVGANKGTATGLSEGPTDITAELNGISGVQTLQVKNIEIVSIVVAPPTASLPVGENLQYTATATFNDTSTAEVTSMVTWYVGSTLVADIGNSVDNKGQATAVGVGNTTVWCISSNQVASGPVQLSVTTATLSSISIEPDNPSVVLGASVNFTATGHYSDGSQLPLTTEVAWNSTDEDVATVSNAAGSEGVATTLSEGNTYISASKDGIDSNSSRLEVVAPTLETITLTPIDASIEVGETVQYTAMGHYSDDVDRNITELAYWDSTDDSKAQVSNAPGTKGLATGTGEGQAQITASYQGIDSSAVTVTVTTPINQQPVAVVSGDSNATAGIVAAFSGDGSYDTDGTIENYTFNFGDGTPVVDNGSNPDVTHTFASANTYTVLLTVTDNLGATGSDTMQVVVTETQNDAPHAVLFCPGSGQIGEVLNFDGSSSYDDDGTIVNYTFNFGDGTGNFDNGANPTLTHSFATEDTFTVSLTVTDDDGAPTSTTCQVAIGASDIPEVRIIRPQGTIDTTQDQYHSVLVDANGQGGYSVTRVVLLANGIEQGEDTTAPYEFDYTVPSNAVTGSTITLQARAYDNNDPIGMGQSQPVFLEVKNYAPVADFTATISDALEVTVDATACTDVETPSADLEVRWDWDSDGTWDEDWSTTKILSHTYPLDGQYTITMEVRDGDLQTDSTDRTVDLASTQTVGGVVTTTTWYGTIIVTGSVTVPAGEVLTINPNTNILVMFYDEGSDGNGDFGITIDGEVQIDASSESPVLFTMYGSDHKVPGAWQGIKVTGDNPSLFNHVIVEYGYIGLEIQNDSTVSNSTFRFNEVYGLYLNGASNATLTDVTVTQNEEIGMYINNSSNVTMSGLVCNNNGDACLRLNNSNGGSLTTCAITLNGGDGIDLIDSDLDITDCSINYNGGIGVKYVGGSDGSLSQSEITYNDDVGIRAESASSHPHPTINYNNIFGNSTVAGTTETTIDPSATLTLTGPYSSGTYNSSVWSTPSGGLVRRAYFHFNENYSSYGYLQTGSGTNITSQSNTWEGWVNAASHQTSDLRVSLYQNSSTSSNYTNLVEVTSVEYTAQVGVGLEMSVSVFSGAVNARYNYWGSFPNVLDHIDYNTPGAVDIQGFVGVAFDASWDTGPYKAGDLSSQTWSGTIYVTGDTSVPAAETLTIDAGTQVLFVPTDQDFDGIGDYGIYVAGTMTVNGTSGDHVDFTAHGVSPTTSSFDRVRLAGSGTSYISYADFTYGHIGLEIQDASTLDYSTFENNNLYGLYLNNADSCTVDNILLQNNQDVGIRALNTSGASLTYIEIQNNPGDAMQVSNCSSSTLQDSYFHDNAGAGLVLEDTSWDVDHCAFLYNGNEGIRYLGASSGTLTYSNVKFNDLPGIIIESQGSPWPEPDISSCNIFGNSLINSVELTSIDPSATLTLTGPYSSGTYNSSVWNTPNGRLAVRAYFHFNENYSAYGYLQTGPGTNITSQSNTWEGWVNTDAYATDNLRVSLYQNSSTSSNYTNLVEVTSVEYLDLTDPNNQIEMTTATNGGTVTAQGNYWGQNTNVTERISMSRAGAVDPTSWQMSAVDPCGPR